MSVLPGIPAQHCHHQKCGDVVKGCAYTISTMSRSSDKNSISFFFRFGEVERAAVLRTPSRTPRLHVEASCDGSSKRSSGGFPEVAA